MKFTKKEQIKAIQKLKELLPEKSTIYTNLKHVSKSGMSRSISLHIVVDNEINNITFLVAQAMGNTFDQKNNGVKVTGCGMDMGFHIVNNLSYILHGFPSGNNSNKRGYTLKHSWI